MSQRLTIKYLQTSDRKLRVRLYCNGFAGVALLKTPALHTLAGPQPPYIIIHILSPALGTTSQAVLTGFAA